jgi:FlaG/FlaF family flagellin (archaellin)
MQSVIVPVRSPAPRALSPVVGTVALLAVTATLVGVLAFIGGWSAPPDPPVRAALDLSVDADGRITLIHAGGDPLDVRDLRMQVRVDGIPLDHHPPIPFFSAPGFVSGSTGPFNPADDPEWTAGETTSVRVASTNDPTVSAGSRVSVTVYLNDTRLWSGSTRAG